MKEAFENWNPQGTTQERVEQCEEIADEYQAQGFVLTLRQLYYQLVSRALIPNTEKSYRNLGSIVSRARLAGMLDWDAIKDRGRQPDVPLQYDGLRHLAQSALGYYRLDRWAGQSVYTELWVEKDALAEVLEPLAREFHTTLMVNKGYSSQSAMYESAQRLIEAWDELNGSGYGNESCCIFYLGDHDPSGQDMVRDIEARLTKFTRGEIPLQVKLIALTTQQVEQYDPPPNPTKVTDSRAKQYIARHGHECWEVDALDPATLQQLIRDEFEAVIDFDLMAVVKEQEKEDKRKLTEAVKDL